MRGVETDRMEALDRSIRQPRVLAGPGMVTVIAGLTFAISDQLGDIDPGPMGLLADDTRHLSVMRLRVDGRPLHHLGSGLVSPDAARFHAYPDVGAGPDASVEVIRTRRVAPRVLTEEIALRSWESEPIDLTVTLELGCDFADIFEVRRVGAPPGPAPHPRADPGRGTIEVRADGLATIAEMTPRPDAIEGGIATWRLRLEPHRPHTLHVEVCASADGEGAEPHAADWDGPATSVWTEPAALGRGIRMGIADLRSLTLVDDLDPARRLVAAGIPWFVALFGRDSLLVSHQARAFDPGLALATLRALAARQGRVTDPGNGEEPGKILHEVRLTRRPWLGEGTSSGARPYFGSVDATPLFLLVLASAWRWGAPDEAIDELLPAARRALGWMRGPGDPDGDGMLEYRPTGPRSLGNQAWKDSENAVQFADGTLAEPPIAMCEVQGYAYRARREMAALLASRGADGEAADLTSEADALRDAIRARYWMPGAGGAPGAFAMALDGEKRQVDGVASNMGHLLWCDVPDPDQARQVAARLTAPDMASGWGLRTLSSEMAGFNPISYHVGSVWPHDTALACDGLRRYGLDDAALALASALLDALVAFEGRLPELFGGHAREAPDFPVPYPTACRPQAWAAGVPLAFVPMLLGLDPSIPEGTITLAPVLPPGATELVVRGVPFPGGPLSVTVVGSEVRILERPAGVTVAVRPDPAGRTPPRQG